MITGSLGAFLMLVVGSVFAADGANAQGFYSPSYQDYGRGQNNPYYGYPWYTNNGGGWGNNNFNWQFMAPYFGRLPFSGTFTGSGWEDDDDDPFTFNGNINGYLGYNAFAFNNYRPPFSFSNSPFASNNYWNPFNFNQFQYGNYPRYEPNNFQFRSPFTLTSFQLPQWPAGFGF